MLIYYNIGVPIPAIPAPAPSPLGAPPSPRGVSDLPGLRTIPGTKIATSMEYIKKSDIRRDKTQQRVIENQFPIFESIDESIENQLFIDSFLSQSFKIQDHKFQNNESDNNDTIKLISMQKPTYLVHLVSGGRRKRCH